MKISKANRSFQLAVAGERTSTTDKVNSREINKAAFDGSRWKVVIKP